MTVSVVVPTRDRPEALAACVAALERQTEPVEIVVLDDVDGRGPAFARNAGARAARGDIICFTDDDCRPVPGWAAAIRARIEAGADVVAGPTVNGRPNDVWSAASQAMTNHLVDASRHGERVGFAPTSNVGGRAEVIRAEPFDESYPLAAGEDREWCDRIVARGARFVFADDVVVHHHQDLSARRFVRQQLRYGRGARRYRAEGTKQPAGFYAGLVRAGFREGPRAGALVVAAQAIVAIGYVRG